MPIDRRLLFNIDWGFLAAALILLGIGVATILSATFAGRNSGLEFKQLYAIPRALLPFNAFVDVRGCPGATFFERTGLTRRCRYS